MLALTYLQHPKKEKTTIRLKRIGQRFLPSYKHIREQKFDVFGTFSRKKATRQFVPISAPGMPPIRIKRSFSLTKQRIKTKILKYNLLKNTQRPSIETKVLRKSNVLYTSLPWFDKQSNPLLLFRARRSGALQTNLLYNQDVLYLKTHLQQPDIARSNKLIKILHPSRKPRRFSFNKKKMYPSLDDLSHNEVLDLARRGELQHLKNVEYTGRLSSFWKDWQSRVPVMSGGRLPKIATSSPNFPQNLKVIRKRKFKDFFKNERSRRVFSSPLQIFWKHVRGSKVLGDLSTSLRSQFFSRKRYVPFRIDDYSQNKKRPRMSTYKLMVFAYRRLRLFYGNLKESKMRRLLTKTTSRQHASFIFGKMERRLDVLLWRTNICDTIHIAQQFVRNGHVLVDGKKIRNYFYPIKNFQMVSFVSEKLRDMLKIKFFEKLRLKKLKFPLLKYIKMNPRMLIFYCIPIVQPYKYVPMSYKLRHSSLQRYII